MSFKEETTEKKKENMKEQREGGEKQNRTTEIALDLHSILAFTKKNWIALLLIAFMLFGLWLRSYHMDFPVIGYHNMKENQYIPYTEFMYNADEIWDYFRTETYLAGTQEHGYFTQYEFPLIPWIILAFWKIVGIKLWAARFVIILFSIASIPLLYLVGKKLTDNTFILLAACLFFTIMPISIFFGRNVQPEAAGVFFILLASYCFFCWHEEVLSGKLLFRSFLLFSLSILIAILLKIPHGIGLIPLLFFVPYKTFFENKRYLFQCVALFLCILAIFPVWVKFSQWVMPGAATVGTSGFGESFREVHDNVIRVFTSAYWYDYFPAIKSFYLDNFTLWFFWLPLFGIVLGFFKWKTKLGMFFIGSFFSVFIYFLSFADKIRGHAYYQMVFLPFICLAAAYALYVLTQFLEMLVFSHLSSRIASLKKYCSLLPYALLILFVFLAYPSLVAATNRVFDTIFYGEDVAGDFINKNSAPEDRIFIDGVFAQSSGIFWHAHRYGIDEISPNLTWFQELEDSLHFHWVVLYGPGISTVQTKPDVWNYIQNTYKIRQIGLLVQNGQYVPYYFVLEKGGNFTPEEFIVNKTPYLAETYTTTQGEIPFYAVDDVH